MVNNFERHYLTDVLLKLSITTDVVSVVDIIKHAARILTGADGATFVLKEKEKCFYIDEDSILPLWKGSKFPIAGRVCGWAMLKKETVYVKDIYEDSRLSVESYSSTFVKSIVAVPINTDRPIGAIGNYWAHLYEPSDDEIDILELLADCAAMALNKVNLLNSFNRKCICDYLDIIREELNANELNSAETLDELSLQSPFEKNKSSHLISCQQRSAMSKRFQEFLMEK